MRYALPLGTVLLVGIAFGSHGSPSPKPAGERQERSRPAAVSGESAIVAVQPAGRELRESPAAGGTTRPAEAKPAAPAIGQAGWRKIAAVLEKEIVLTPLQRASVEQILRERDDEIQTCHQEMRKAGVVDILRYEWQVGLMKDTWYSRLDALLDWEQHHLLVALVQKGFLNEGLAFTIDPGMTVLD